MRCIWAAFIEPALCAFEQTIFETEAAGCAPLSHLVADASTIHHAATLPLKWLSAELLPAPDRK